MKDYKDLLKTATSEKEKTEFKIWQSFVRERAHILRRGVTEWPTYKILLQLAVEHADDSPITIAAETWLNKGHCDWVWLRNIHRPQQMPHNPCLVVLEGHEGLILGTITLDDGRIVSWSEDLTIRIWDGEDGYEIAVLEGHDAQIKGVIILSICCILSWSVDGTFRIWDVDKRCEITASSEPSGFLDDTKLFPDGRKLFWSWEKTLEINDLKTKTTISVLNSKTNSIKGEKLLPDGQIIYWSWEKNLKISDGENSIESIVYKEHSAEINECVALPGKKDGGLRSSDIRYYRFIMLSTENTLKIWDDSTESEIKVLNEHSNCGQLSKLSALSERTEILPGGRKLYWTFNTLRILDAINSCEITTFTRHFCAIDDAIILEDGSILAWTINNTLKIFDAVDGYELAEVMGHEGENRGALTLLDGRIISWTEDKYLIILDNTNSSNMTILKGHTDNVISAKVLPNGQILSWSLDNTLRIWNPNTGDEIALLTGHKDLIIDAIPLTDDRILSWSLDNTLIIWDTNKTVFEMKVLQGHSDYVQWATMLPNSHILSWSYDDTLRIWDANSGAEIVKIYAESEYSLQPTLISNDRILTETSSQNSELTIWDVNTGTEIAILSKLDFIETLPCDRILCQTKDFNLKILNSKSGIEEKLLIGHSSLINGMSLLAKDRMLSWSEDCTLRIWNVNSGELIAELNEHTGSVIGATHISTGQIFSWSNNEICVWSSEGKLELKQPYPISTSGAETFTKAPTVFAHLNTKSKNDIFFERFIDCNFSGIVCWLDDCISNRFLFNLGKGRLVVKTEHKQMVWLQLYKGANELTA